MHSGDELRFLGLRKHLIGKLRQKNIRDDRVLQAIEIVPRHLFMPHGMEQFAYEDRAFPIGNEQTISQPFTVAFQSQLLEVQESDVVLEIGSGSGYQAAILSLLAKKVYSIERQKYLYDELISAEKIIPYHNLDLHFGDGFLGLPAFQPFDKIIITAAVNEVPQNLFNQLKVNGFLVLPLGDDKKTQTMTRIIKINATEWTAQRFEDFQFVPMLKGTN